MMNNPIRIVATVHPAGLSPRGLREAFAQALREGLSRAYEKGRIDNGQHEELYRALPAKGHA